MRPRLAVLLLPLLPLLAAPALAADPATKEFKKAVKSRMKDFSQSVTLALAPVESELDSAALAYGQATTTAFDALQQAAASVLVARDAIEDAAFETATSLQADGHQALLLAQVVDASVDFQAGGQGLWDHAVRDIGRRMDKADKTLRKAWKAFVKDFIEAGELQTLVLDVRSQLPPHGTAWRGVAPPGAVPTTGTLEGVPLQGPQMLLAARLIETSTPDTLLLGIRAATADVEVHVASNDTEDAPLGTPVMDEAGLALSSFALDTLAQPQGFVVVGLDDGTLTSADVAVSAPTLAADPNSADALDELAANLKTGKKALLGAASDAVQELKLELADQAADVDSGALTPDAALTAGFGSLATAQEAIGLAWTDFVASTASQAAVTLSQAGVDNSALPGGFQPDAAGLSATSQAVTLQKLAKQQAKLGKSFTGFTTKMMKTADANSSPFSVNVVTGAGAGFSAPMVSAASNPALLPTTSAGLVDGLTLGITSGGTTTFTGMINVQGDPAALTSMSLSSTTVPGGVAGDLGSVALNAGGTQSLEFPLTVDEGISGFTFNGGATATNQSSPMVLSTPTATSAP